MKNMQLKRVLAVMLTAAMAMPSPLGAIPRSYATELVLDEPIELQSEQQQNDVLELQQDQQQQDVIERVTPLSLPLPRRPTLAASPTLRPPTVRST